MATTINSGYANSPKLTANIADHADVYGGRALVFDGVSDYLDCGDLTFLNSASAFSMSVWIKSDNTNSLDYLYNKTSSSSNLIRMAIAYNIMYFNVYNGGNAYGSVAFTSTDWNHISLVFNGSGTGNSNRLKAYINGEEQSLTYTGTIPSATGNLSGTAFQIGKYLTDHFEGSMCDFKIFDSHLTEAQVQELYKKPENTPSAVQDNLVAWYPMIEGNPESPQSIVYDHSEKKLSSNILTNGTFDTDISGWANSSPDTTSSTDFRTITHATIDGRTCIDINDQSIDPNGSRMYAYYDLGSSLLKFNTLYKISYYARKSQSDSTNKQYAVALGHQHIGITAGTVFKSVSEWDTWEYHELYIVSSTSNYRLQFLNTAFNNGLNNGHKGRLFLDDIKVQEVLMGNHATTNFFGDELITNSADREFTSDTGFWNLSGATITGNKLVFNNNSALNRRDGLLTNSKNYQVIVDVSDYTSGSFKVYAHGTQSSAISSQTVHTVNITAGTSNDIFGFNCTAFTGSINSVSVKEVGVLSSGFETAVNEPVVPQVPLMRYNQKMLFDGSDGYVQLPAPLSSTNHTISAWYVANSGDNYILDARDGGADGIALGLLANGTIWYAVRGSGSNSVSSSSGSFNVLNHVVATYNGSTAKIYLNGVEVGSGTFTDTISTTTNARIGRISYADSGYFDGVVHEVAFYNKDFTQADAQELFNDGVALDATTHSKADDNLLGYWRNDGVTTWTDRGDIQAIGFDGNNDYIPFSFPTLGNAFTLSAWVYFNIDASTSDFDYLISVGAGGTRTNFSLGRFQDGVYYYFDGTVSRKSTSFTFSTKTWTHVVATVQPTSNRVKLYINGEEQDVEQPGGDFNISSSTGAIGRYQAGSAHYLNGLMSQVAIWNDTLSAEDVSNIYALGRRNVDLSVSYSTNLVGYWMLNPSHSSPDLTGTDKILDRSGNGNHGTQNGGVSFLGGNDGNVQGSPDSITIREGLNSNRDGLGFYFTNPSSNVLRLNGVSEYLEIPDNKVFSFGDSNGDLPFSIEAWIKPENATNFTIISKGKYNVDGEYLLQLDADKKLYFALYDGNAYEGALYNTALGDYEGSWLHICATYNGVGGTSANAGIKLYVDSEQKSVSLLGGNTYVAMHNDSGEVEIGKYDNIYANGIIDELRIYNKELSLTEIQKNYKHQKGKHKND